MSLLAASTVHHLHDGEYDAEIQPGWDIMGNANGGYLMAIVARAASHAAGRPDPVTVTAHFLAPGKPGPVRIDTRSVRAGRRFATVAATMTADDRPIMTMLGTFTDHSAAEDAVTRYDGGPPDLPSPEACVGVDPSARFAPPFAGKVDFRLHPDDVPFVSEPTGRMEIRGWFRLLDDEPVDPFGLLLAADAFPPTIFNSGLPVGWVPTLELTVHVRARPAPGWLAAVASTRFVGDGFLEEDAEIWDATGRLVAQSRQLALLPRP